MAARPLIAVFPAAEVGGAERYVEAVLAAAAVRGWRTAAAFPATPATAAFRASLEQGGVRTLPLGIGEPAARPGAPGAALQLLRDLLQTWWVLIRARPGAVLLNLPHPEASPGAVLACALFPGRRVAVVHLVPGDLEISRARRMLYRLSRRLGLGWISVAADSAARLARAFDWPRGAIAAIPNGVTIPQVTGDERAEARRAVREELGLEPDAPIVLTVARLQPQKGHDVLVDAIRRIPPGPARWVWAGDGESRPALEARLAEAAVADRVLLLGTRSDPERLLLAADLFVLPSRAEGMPFALLEALAAGVPVIATALPGIAALIDDGVHGSLVAPEMPGPLAAAMRIALSHPERMAGQAEAALARVRERHSAQEMTDRVLDQLGGTVGSAQ